MSKRTKVETDWLDRALFVSSNYYCLCTSEAEFNQALDDLDVQKDDRPKFVLNWHSDATAHHFEEVVDGHPRKTIIVCVRLREGVSGTQIAALLVHEAVHIWQATKRDYGESEPSSELEAYAIQNISQRLMESYERKIVLSKNGG